MATTTNRRGNVKREAGDEASEVVRDHLEELGGTVNSCGSDMIKRRPS